MLPDHLPLQVFDPDVSIDPDNWSLDDYVVGEIEQIDWDSEQFDLITAFRCMDHLNVPEVFDRVDKWLKPGGVFFFNMTNWYELHGGAMKLPMDAPWMHARLSKSELLEYYKNIVPRFMKPQKKLFTCPQPI